MTGTTLEEGGGSHMRLLYVLTGLVVLLGVYFRFKGLGFSPLAIDEYYLTTSVNSILEHGLPRFEGGGFYTRGLVLQYMAAALFMTGMSEEFAFRLITVLFNLAALPAVYLLARRMAGAVAGCVAVMLFSLAVWEVEFARFARMYAPFATLFLWYLYFLYRRIVENDSGASNWMYGTTFVSIFFSEFSVFLALANFLPLCLRPARRPLLDYLAPTVVLALTYEWLTANFRRFEVVDPYPADFVAGTGASELPVYLPPVMIPEMAGSVPWLLGFLVPLVVAIVASVGWVRWARRLDGDTRTRLLAIFPIGIIGLALMNLFGLAVWATLILALLSGLGGRELAGLARRPLVLFTGVSVIVSLVFWGAYVAGTDWWREALPISTSSHVKDAVLVLFNYPNMLRDVVAPWRAALPIQSALMVALVMAGIGFASGRDETRLRGYRLLAAVTLGMFLLVPIFAKPYYTTRYTYFLYPVLLILSAASIAFLSTRFVRRATVAAAASVVAVAAFVWVSEDFEARHLTEIDSERVTYRMDYPQGKVDQYYLRWDYRGPAEYVNDRLQPGDTVISAEYSVPYYLDRMDYLYMDIDGGRFWIVTGQQGTRDIWEGARLLYTEDQVFDVIRNAPGTVWFIGRSDNYGFQTAGEVTVSARFGDDRVYRSVDGNLDVYRFSAGRAATGDVGNEQDGR